MKLSLLPTISLSLLPTLILSQEVRTVAFDPLYDNSEFSLLTTSCSDGNNGLVTKGYDTVGELPSFPYVGAAFSIENWNSPNCGKCYSITYEATGTQIFVTAIDKAGDGFNLAKKAMDDLTGGRAEELGRADMTVAEASPADCGF
ncbi:hypothetical protein FQN50_008771 [Emmonsiellopsis sp. PD_5]|nr:hypothetical protein FQN50_008771 [Emmonsiellopsis sp. PD_5]